MKTILFAAAVAGFAAAASAPGMAMPPAPANSVCLWTYNIDHTTVVNPSTVLFHMRNGEVWRNTLKGPCPGLKYHGFAYLTQSENICSNGVPITVIETHQACSLGVFTPEARASGSMTP
ncbi:MAG TPA: hypothetical protein VGI20_04990 [Rhizomicrobium sp.]